MYDITVITDTEKDIESVAAHVESVGGKILKQQSLGMKSFAYPIGKKLEGVYTILIVDVPNGKIVDLNRELITDSKIIRHLTLKTDSGSLPQTAEQQHEAYLERRGAAKETSTEQPKKAPTKPATVVEVAPEKPAETAKRRKAVNEKLDEILKEK